MICSYTFSTHDLSGRSTFGLRLCVRGTLFSTHDLSGRSTISRYIRRTHWFFQLTTSRGGRLYSAKQELYGSYFSTHDLSGRSTLSGFVWLDFNGFFNSRPLGEVDLQFYVPIANAQFFNSRPLVEVDSKTSQ